MNRQRLHQVLGTGHPLSRRTVLRHALGAGALAAGAMVAGGARRPDAEAAPAHDGADLQPGDAVQGILAAIARFPIVAIAERHMLQEWHDVITALLLHPALPGTITDIAVEFGNAAYQDLADRFVLSDEPVARADLVQIWRQIGDPSWNAPVYEQFFHTVRAVNWMQPAARRIRVLLGQPPVTMSQVIAHPHDRGLINTLAGPMDDFYASLLEREVLRKRRRALLIAGKGHLLRGLYVEDNPHHQNAVSQLAQRLSGALYVIDNLILPPGTPPDASAQRVHAELGRRPRPVVAPLAGTWLGAMTKRVGGGWINEMADRALRPADARYGAQADAVLYLGPGELLTASQPDPAIYHWGAYPAEVRRAAAIAGAGDQVAFGLRWAQAGPSWFDLFG